jgi:hypothetical protein
MYRHHKPEGGGEAGQAPAVSLLHFGGPRAADTPELDNPHHLETPEAPARKPPPRRQSCPAPPGHPQQRPTPSEPHRRRPRPLSYREQSIQSFQRAL